ncbi:MAG: hypothetical protein PF484_14930 [Bacteroidales bacterium]|jgi:methionine synthase II (cobalamin-independent)|nr:hypothetical protein [Bacteroidales bacterium]
MSKIVLTKEIEIEDLVNHYPHSVRYLSEKGIRCIACGEPIWGTLEEAALQKGFDQDQIGIFVKELIAMGEKI